MAHEPRFFEGTEKKVELVVGPALPSFRSLGEAYWREIVRYAHAEVLSSVSNDRCDAYLLSESSLFVYDHKMIMITCGRTQLDGAVLRLLADAPPEHVRMFVYERKNEVFPHSQPTSFEDDVRRLQRLLPGRAYRFGDEDEHHLLLFHLDRPLEPDPDDATLEILMYGLDERAREAFGGSARAGAGGVRESTGLDRVLDGYLVDDHAFRPSGYSLNAIRDDRYYTVHVTPEPHASYASFETNACGVHGCDALLGRVLSIFRPRAFDVIGFDRRAPEPVAVEGYRVKNHVVAELEIGYGVRFQHFYRPRGEHGPVRIEIE